MVDRLAPCFCREPEWADDWSLAMFSSGVEARINRGRTIEPDVSEVLISFEESFATELIRILLELAGVDVPAQGLELWSGSRLLRHLDGHSPGDRRNPDLIICRGDDRRHVVLVVEVKGLAKANGGGCYCSGEHVSQGYSSQVVCYLEGCWTTLDLSDVPRVLLGPDANRGINGGWGRRAVYSDERIRDEYGAPDAIEARRRAFELWRFIGLREFEDQVRLLPSSLAKETFLDVLVPWLDRKGL